MSLLKNVGTIGGLTLVSRLFGFARDILLARVLGAGGVADAWQLAFQLPNLFRRLFAEGAFASAFVPLFNRHMAEDEPAAKRFAGEILAVLLPILVVFGAVMMVAMPWVTMGITAIAQRKYPSASGIPSKAFKAEARITASMAKKIKVNDAYTSEAMVEPI